MKKCLLMAVVLLVFYVPLRADAELVSLDAGDLGLILRCSGDGVQLVRLFDKTTNRQVASSEPSPLFAITLRHTDTKQHERLTADAGWSQVEVKPLDDDHLVICFGPPKHDRYGQLRVVLRATADRSASVIRWKMEVENESQKYSLWNVAFPEISLADFGSKGRIFFPRGSGEVHEGAWEKKVEVKGRYPNGWVAMQFMAAYDPEHNTGLYLACHDPRASTKEIRMNSRPSDRTVVMGYDFPVPNMGTAGNDFTLPGHAAWQLLRGDWFDASMIYRGWVRRHAKWYPELTSEGRADTPQWMRELPAWALASGAAEDCVPRVLEFAQFLGVPVGLHWYSWHQIPFDNDYPHYFPVKAGFAEGVRKLQDAGVYVMPYINGRLWDTRDRGTQDHEFTRVALPAAAKDEKGKPISEKYGSKESDGAAVELAVMCPTASMWHDKIRETVLRLFDECGVKGVYIDQIAAATPRLCFDRTHGHPLGGGQWWTKGYWEMLDKIHQAIPEDRMLTSECNAEPFLKWFDGYLTWHWQFQGQVPAFPAVYGGAIQMFGRAYRGGETKDLALRMKAAQQLVFGEQIGWITPNVVKEKENAEFLRQVVRLRWRFRRYFHVGRMARPPKLHGEIPEVGADWQWSGKWWVTTDAAMIGAWQLPGENRAVLLMANVSDDPVTARLDLDLAAYGLPGTKVRVTMFDADKAGESFTVANRLQREVTLPPRMARAWELVSN